MLCGPLTQDMHAIAVEELAIAHSKRMVNQRQLRKNVSIDRLAIQATRIQVEMLLEDVKDRDVQLELVRNAFENYRSKVQDDFQNLQQRFDEEIHLHLTSQATLFDAKYKAAQEALATAELEASSLRNQIHRNTPVLWSPRAVLRKGSDEENLQRIIKLQATARGFVARAKVERTKLYHSAIESGVLVALKGTSQGK